MALINFMQYYRQNLTKLSSYRHHVTSSSQCSNSLRSISMGCCCGMILWKTLSLHVICIKRRRCICMRLYVMRILIQQMAV